MFERYTEKARRVIFFARYEASQFGAPAIEPEHLLLGLLREDRSMAAEILYERGLRLNAVREEIARQTGVDARATQKKDTPHLVEFSRDLTEDAASDKLDPLVGREAEIERVIQILCRRTKNNPVLIGEPGVGKTAIVESLSQRIVKRDVPEQLRDKKLVAIDLGSMVAGTKFRGEFEDRLKAVLREIVESNGEIICFIDELHTLVGAGSAEGAIDAANLLKPALAR